MFLVEAAARPAAPEEPENLDIAVEATKNNLRVRLEQALTALNANGVRNVGIDMIGHSAIVHLQGVSYYHVGLVIHQLRKIGEVTIHFPPVSQE